MKEMQATMIYFDSLIEWPVSFSMQDYEADKSEWIILTTRIWWNFSKIPNNLRLFPGKSGVCEILLENQADVDHTDKEGKSALFAAASMGHLDIVNILLFWGCYADGIDCEGRTVLSVAAAEGSAGVVQVSSVICIMV